MEQKIFQLITHTDMIESNPDFHENAIYRPCTIREGYTVVTDRDRNIMLPKSDKIWKNLFQGLKPSVHQFLKINYL
jgi:hypothetical protein